jgi:hypothetical protein
MHPLTATQQRNDVSEGTALGFALLGVYELPYSRVTVDLCFTRAFLSWPHACQYPTVVSDLHRHRDGYRVMTRATATKRSWALYWDRSNPLSIQLRGDSEEWDAGEAHDIALGIHPDIPAEAWRSLAEEITALAEPRQSTVPPPDSAGHPRLGGVTQPPQQAVRKEE